MAGKFTSSDIFAYDGTGQMTRITDALGNVKRYEYQGGGRPKSITDAIGTVMQFTYDGFGNVSSTTNGAGETATFTYNKDGNAVSKTLTRSGENGANKVQDIDDFDIFSALKIAKDSFQRQDPESYRRLMNIYLRRWPHAIQFKLLYGEFLNQVGSIEEGAKLIHSTIESDLLGMIAGRLWGERNSYRRLFFAPEELSVDLSGIPIPEKIVQAAKLERIPGISVADDDLSPDEPLETERSRQPPSGSSSAPST